MNRFINPHQFNPNMPTQNNMQMQPNMPMQNNMFMPMQNNMPMQQPNVQMIPVQTPYGIQMQPMVMLPNGQMQPLAQYQNNIPMPPNMSMQVNRPQQVSVPQGFLNLSQEQELRNRFQQQQPQVQETQTMKPNKVFNVTPVKNVTAEFNNAITFSTYIEEVKDNHVCNIDKEVIVDCFNEAIESIIETANTDSSKLITTQKFIINNKFYKTTKDKELKDLIKTDIKSIYKSLKSIFPAINNKYDLNMFNRFDTILTDYINDYLFINSNSEISIDSFMGDFNDLLKVIRNNSEDLEDYLIDDLNNYLAKIVNNFKLLEKCDETCFIPEEVTLTYIDKFLIETGLQDLSSTFAKVEISPINVFINSLAKHIFNNSATNSFTLVTIDKEIVTFMQDISGNVWVKKIS